MKTTFLHQDPVNNKFLFRQVKGVKGEVLFYIYRENFTKLF